MSHGIPLFEIRYDDDVSKVVAYILDNLNIPHDNPVPSPDGDDAAGEGETTISQESRLAVKFRLPKRHASAPAE